MAFDSDWNIIDPFPSYLEYEFMNCSKIGVLKHAELGLGGTLNGSMAQQLIDSHGVLRGFDDLQSSLFSYYLLGLGIAAVVLFGVVIWKLVIGDVNKERFDDVIRFVDNQPEGESLWE